MRQRRNAITKQDSEREMDGAGMGRGRGHGRGRRSAARVRFKNNNQYFTTTNARYLLPVQKQTEKPAREHEVRGTVPKRPQRDVFGSPAKIPHATEIQGATP